VVIIPLQISSFKDPSANDRAGQIYSSLVERYGVGRAIAITWSKLREEGWNLAKEPPQAPTPPPEAMTKAAKGKTKLGVAYVVKDGVSYAVVLFG
jgi:hypothetical protein